MLFSLDIDYTHLCTDLEAYISKILDDFFKFLGNLECKNTFRIYIKLMNINKYLLYVNILNIIYRYTKY